MSQRIDKISPGRGPKPVEQYHSDSDEFTAEQRQKINGLLQIEEEERKSITRKIHDDICQPLAALKINLSLLRRMASTRGEPLIQKVENISQLVDSITRAVKEISVELRPGVLDDLGLSDAIEWLAGYFREHDGMEYEIEVLPEDITLDRQLSTAVFRILHKIMMKFSKQSGIAKVRVRLKKQGDELQLKVITQLEGTIQEQILNPESSCPTGVVERIHILGGKVIIGGNSGKENMIAVDIPLNQT